MVNEWLRQDDVQEEFLTLGQGQWTTVYRSWHENEKSDCGIYCALAASEYREQALSSSTWDLMVTDGRPGFSQGPGENGELVTTYHRGGGESEVEPLVLLREFHGVRPSYPEIVQEFRLFHNLWWDNERHVFMKTNEDGTEEVAIKVSDSEIRVKTRLLRQYQAARQLDLLLFIDSVRYASSDEVVLPEEKTSSSAMTTREKRYDTRAIRMHWRTTSELTLGHRTT